MNCPRPRIYQILILFFNAGIPIPENIETNLTSGAGASIAVACIPNKTPQRRHMHDMRSFFAERMAFSQFDDRNFGERRQLSGERKTRVFVERSFDNGVRRAVLFGQIEGECFDRNVFSPWPWVIDEPEDDMRKPIDIVRDESALIGEHDDPAITDDLPCIVANRVGLRNAKNGFAPAECFRRFAEKSDGKKETHPQNGEFPRVEIPKPRKREPEKLGGDDYRHDPCGKAIPFADALANFDHPDPFVIAFCQDASRKEWQLP